MSGAPDPFTSPTRAIQLQRNVDQVAEGLKLLIRGGELILGVLDELRSVHDGE